MFGTHFALSTLVDTRKKLSLDTFVCFVDFQKAYDKVIEVCCYRSYSPWDWK